MFFDFISFSKPFLHCLEFNIIQSAVSVFPIFIDTISQCDQTFRHFCQMVRRNIRIFIMQNFQNTICGMGFQFILI